MPSLAMSALGHKPTSAIESNRIAAQIWLRSAQSIATESRRETRKVPESVILRISSATDPHCETVGHYGLRCPVEHPPVSAARDCRKRQLSAQDATSDATNIFG